MKMDIHLHSNFSDGRDSPEELVIAAIELGFDMIAITDHVRKESDWLDEYVDEMKKLQRNYKGKIKILSGIEAKVIDLNGNIDANPEFIQKIDLVMAAFHRIPTENGYIHRDQLLRRKDDVLDYWFQAMMAILENKDIDIVAHPTNILRKNNIELPTRKKEEIAKKASIYGKVFEKNLKYHVPDEEFLKILQRNKVDIHLGSDSHSVEELKSLWLNK